MEIVLRIALTGLLGLSAWHDWRTRTAPNVITIPIFMVGAVAAFARFLEDDWAPLAMLIYLTGAHLIGKSGLGDADIKVIAGLWGLWPQAGVPVMLATALFIVAWRRLHPTDSQGSPVLVAVTTALILTLLIEGSIMFAGNQTQNSQKGVAVSFLF